MRKNFLCCVRIETELSDKLKKQALEEELSFSEFIRKKLKQPSSRDKMQIMIEEMHKKLVNKQPICLSQQGGR
jgi:hypothetical protein